MDNDHEMLLDKLQTVADAQSDAAFDIVAAIEKHQLTKRQQFALAAMQSLLSNTEAMQVIIKATKNPHNADDVRSTLKRHAFLIADEMLTDEQKYG